jgi:HPt (histidine-containing phosphotransfer) domain-containing protein
VVPDAVQAIPAGHALNRAVLAAWFDDDAAAADRLIDQFRSAANDALAAMRIATQGKDWAGLVAAAHRLRGSAAAIGAAGVAETAARLEHAARVEDDQGCEEGLLALAQVLHMAAESM